MHVDELVQIEAEYVTSTTFQWMQSWVDFTEETPPFTINTYGDPGFWVARYGSRDEIIGGHFAPILSPSQRYLLRLEGWQTAQAVAAQADAEHARWLASDEPF